jgi:CSLREA domain-containing protein
MTKTLCHALLSLAVLAPASAHAQAVTFTVNSTADSDDGTCDVAHCSLREAINAANTNAGFDTVAFAIPGPGTRRIAPASALPAVSDAVVIDGTTQPGFANSPIIELFGASAGASTVGISLAADGCTVKGLRVMEFATGILIDGGADNVVGGVAASQSNVLTNNSGDGVRIEGATANGNSIQWNTITGNGGSGVVLFDAGTGNTITFNSIFDNGELGIDLGDDGVTPNDPGDADTGPNNLQNFPVLNKVVFGVNRAEGTIDTRPNTDVQVEFFSNDACNTSGHGEGEILHGWTTVTTDANGDAEFAATLAGNAPLGVFVTTTATDADGNTSEYSECEPATTFDIRVSPDSGMVWRGGSDEYAAFVTPEGGAWGQLVTMSCSNLPGVTTCDFTPDTFTLGATEVRSNLVVTTTDLCEAVGPLTGSPGGLGSVPPLLALAVVLLGLLLISIVLRTRNERGRKLGFRAAFGVAVIGLALYTGCGGEDTTEPCNAGTPRGRHTFNIVASTESLTQAVGATLVVQ